MAGLLTRWLALPDARKRAILSLVSADLPDAIMAAMLALVNAAGASGQNGGNP